MVRATTGGPGGSAAWPDRTHSMTLQKLQIEQYSVISCTPFGMVLAALKTALAQPDIAKLMKAARDVFTFAKLEQVVREALGGKELDIVMELDEGEILRRETGRTW